MLVWLRLRELLSRRALLCLLFAAPVVFGYFSSYAVSAKPSLRVAVVDNDNSPFSCEYISVLESYGLELIVTSESEAEALLEKRRIEGLLIIESGFESAVLDKNGRPLAYRAAAGVSTTALVSEQLSLGVVRMRSYALFSEAIDAEMSKTEKSAVFERNADAEPVLYLVGDEAVVTLDFFISPAHGAAALLMSLSALFTAMWLDARAPLPKLFGRRAWLRYYLSSLAAILLIWAALLAVYLLSSLVLYDGFDIRIWLAFAGFLMYCAGMGAAASCLSRGGQNSVYLFAPFFLLNMTVGGALWLQPAESIIVKLIAPAALFLDASRGSETAMVFLFIGGAAMAIVPAASAIPGKRRQL